MPYEGSELFSVLDNVADKLITKSSHAFVGEKAWNQLPSSNEEKAIYYGLHVHSQSNPYGLHTHVIGGKLGGGHTHGPNNPKGQHYHGDSDNPHYHQTDGGHEHPIGHNLPCGSHEHCPSNFA